MKTDNSALFKFLKLISIIFFLYLMVNPISLTNPNLNTGQSNETSDVQTNEIPSESGGGELEYTGFYRSLYTGTIATGSGFIDRIEDTHELLEGNSVIYTNPKGNRQVVQYNRLKKLGDKYKDRWDYFT